MQQAKEKEWERQVSLEKDKVDLEERIGDLYR